MGRQAYLTRLALGRSAFEVTDQSAIPPPPLPPPPQNAHAQRLPPSPPSPLRYYIQQHDSRGHPINPASRDLGRALREAQNDVLAAIGVVERRASPLDEDEINALCRKIDILDTMEKENRAGDVAASLFTLGEVCATWWVGSLRDRVLTFRMPEGMPFSTLVHTQYQAVGPWTFLYAGLPAYLIFSTVYAATVGIVGSWRLIDRLLLWTRASRRTRKIVKRSKPAINTIFRIGAQVAFYPLYYYSTLQRLYLVPLRPFWPPLESFIPFTPSSPIQRIPIPSSFTRESFKMFSTALAASPLYAFFLGEIIKRQVRDILYNAIEYKQVAARSSKLARHEVPLQPRASRFGTLCETTWSFFNSAADALSGYLCLAHEAQHSGRRAPQERYIERELDRIRAEIEIGNLRITALSRLDLPLAHTESVSPPLSRAGQHASALLLDLSRPVSPVSHTISEGSMHAMDPSVRITSRQDDHGIVELEVRLPQLAALAHEEASRAAASAENHDWVFPRATRLSTEPVRMLGAILDSHIVAWAKLPLTLATLRLVARSFYGASPQAQRVQQPGAASLGMFGRVLLCGGVELVLELGCWGIECIAVAVAGRALFRWGEGR